MLRVVGALLAIALANPLCGLDLAICGPIDPMTGQEFRKELTQIVARSEMSARFVPCGSTVAVRLHLLADAPVEEPTALGAAPRRYGQIGPDLRIFVGPIAQLVGTRLPYLLGVAMGRVAAHELGHYLRQDTHHEREPGIMTEGLTGYQLIAAHDFRIPK